LIIVDLTHEKCSYFAVNKYLHAVVSGWIFIDISNEITRTF